MVRRQVFLQVFVERAMLEVDLAFLIAAAAVKAEVKGQNLGQLDLVRFKSVLNRQQLSPGGEGFISGGMVNRTSGHTISTLGAGEDIVSNPFKPLRSDRDPAV